MRAPALPMIGREGARPHGLCLRPLSTLASAIVSRSTCRARVQPHGVLLVSDIRSLRILQVAGETDRILGRSIDTICDHTVAEVLGLHAATLVASAQVTSEPVYLGSVAVAGAKLCLTAHDRDGIRILELNRVLRCPRARRRCSRKRAKPQRYSTELSTIPNYCRVPRARLAASRASTAS